MNLLADTLTWLTDPTHWSGTAGIAHRVAQHLALTTGTILVAASIALPVGILVGHTRRGTAAVASLAGAARAVPTLGIVTLVGLWLGIGLQAPFLALVALAIPSLLAGAYAGVASVDPATVDAARALGMSPRQIIGQVEVPLAAPVILGGLRAATLQVVATATLAAYVSDTGLGRYLFTGLKSRDYPQMLAGALIVTTLALALESTLATLQRQAATRITHPAPTPRTTTPQGQPAKERS